MFKRWFLMVIFLVFAMPSVLYAIGMGGFVDEVFIQTKDFGTVTFTHSIHGINCANCHPKVFKKKNNSNHTTMKWMEKGKSCGACHNGKKAFSVAEKSKCAKCHAGDIVYKIEDPGNVVFPHTAHLENFGCGECHPDIFKAKRGANQATMDDMEEGKSCGACHDGSGAFGVGDDCEACHKI